MFTPSPKIVAVLDDNLSDIDPDAPYDPQIGRNPGILLDHAGLRFGRATQRVENAGELG